MTTLILPAPGDLVYISLPITGHNEAERRARAADIKTFLEVFFRAVVINPFDVADDITRQIKREPTHAEYMKADIAALSTCKHIFVCLGWETSKGCIEEVQYARDNKINFIFQTENFWNEAMLEKL